MPNENSLMIFVSAGPDGLWIQKDAGTVTRTLNEFKKKRQDLKRWRKEHVAPMRWMSEKLFGGFGEQMEKLRETDDEIRKWTRDLDNVLDHARDARKQGRYLDVLFWLNQINGRLQIAIERGRELADISDRQIDEFFSKTRHGLQPDYMTSVKPEDILDPNQKFEDVIAETLGQSLVAQGGVISDLGRELTTWKMNRAYAKRVAELKRGIEHLFNIAKSTVGHIDALMQHMMSARGKGDIAGYLDGLKRVSLVQSKFEKQFKATYENKGFKEMVTRMQARQAEHNKETKVPETVKDFELAPTTIPAAPLSLVQPPPTQSDPVAQPAQSVPQPPMVTPEVMRKNVQAVPPASVSPEQRKVLLDVSPEGEDNMYSSEPKLDPANPAEAPSTIRSRAKTELETIMIKAKHQKFFEELKKESNPYLIAAMLLKYSEMIDDSDPQKSLELISIAEGIFDA